MRTALLLLALALSETPQEDLRKLIDLLHSDKVEEREAAAQKLVELGDPAEALLRKEPASGDAEFSARIKTLLSSLETRRLEKSWDERVRTLPDSCPEASWNMLDSGKIVGTLKLRSSLAKGKLVFEDLMEFPFRGGRLSLKSRQESSVDHTMRLERLEVDASDPALSYSAETRAGKLTLKAKGSTQEIELPKYLLTGPGMFRAIPLLPKQKGFVFKMRLLDEKAQLSEEAVFSCRGEEEISHGGKTVKAWKWAWEHEEAIVGEDENYYYWVTEDRVVRVLRPRGREFVLSSPIK